LEKIKLKSRVFATKREKKYTLAFNRISKIKTEALNLTGIVIENP
jgi:hypothetical protein